MELAFLRARTALAADQEDLAGSRDGEFNGDSPFGEHMALKREVLELRAALEAYGVGSAGGASPSFRSPSTARAAVVSQGPLASQPPLPPPPSPPHAVTVWGAPAVGSNSKGEPQKNSPVAPLAGTEKEKGTEERNQGGRPLRSSFSCAVSACRGIPSPNPAGFTESSRRVSFRPTGLPTRVFRHA